MNYIIAIGAFQAIVATILTGNNKLRKGADSLLVLLLICIGTHLAIKFVIFNLVSDMQVRYQMNTFIGFSYGPLLFLYASKIKNEQYNLLARWYLFVPFLLATIGYLTVVCILSFSTDIGHQVLRLYNNITTYSISGFNLICALLALRKAKLLHTGQKKERQLIFLIGICLALACVIGLVSAVVGAMLQLELNFTVRSICYALFSIICVGILRYKYAGVQVQQPVYMQVAEPVQKPIQTIEERVPEETEEEPAQPAARKAQLTQEEQQAVFEKLEQYLQRSQAYKDPDLTLDKLATAIYVSRYHLSETLNVYLQKTFYQYIKPWRINGVIEQIKRLAPRELPINFLTIAYDNGFKAKSSFNLYFKKMTGRTPTEYVKALLQSV